MNIDELSFFFLSSSFPSYQLIMVKQTRSQSECPGTRQFENRSQIIKSAGFNNIELVRHSNWLLINVRELKSVHKVLPPRLDADRFAYMNPHRHANSGSDVAKTENPQAFCISVDQEVMLRIIFKLIDVDNSGDLSRSEIIKAMRKDPNIAALFGLPQAFAQESDARKKFEELFQTLDTDGSKTISLEEFCRIGMRVKELVPEEQRNVLLLENTWQPNPFMAIGISFAAGVVFAGAVYKYLTDD